LSSKVGNAACTAQTVSKATKPEPKSVAAKVAESAGEMTAKTGIVTAEI
jgi:hypothetical protein